MKNIITPTEEDIENAKTMLVNVYYQKIPLVAENEKHCEILEKLTPLIAVPWFLGTQLFIKSQWVQGLIINKINVINYNMEPTKNMLKACKYHAEVIKNIYEILKETEVITNKKYFKNIPTWLGLIIHDVITYRIHTICTDDYLCLKDVTINHNNIKEKLIEKEKHIFDSPVTFKNNEYLNVSYKQYTALNKFILLSNEIAINNFRFGEYYYEPFKKSYQKYLQSLKAKWWASNFDK
jgi:hypothetical protein